MAEFAAHRSYQHQQQAISNANSATAINDVKALEHPTLKVPYEILNKRFRSTQKSVDREVAHLQSTLNDLERTVSSQTTVGQLTELLTGVIDKVASLKRKTGECITDELDAANVCKKRLEHLGDYCLKSTSESSLDEATVNQWKKKRLDRMLVEHFLRCGYYDTAIKLAATSEIEHFTNIELFLVSRKVEESLAQRETKKCIEWCHDNKSKLRKIKSSLEFNLRQQEFVELVRAGRRIEAVVHAKKYFIGLEPEQQEELQTTMGLLAFKKETQIEPYRTLFDESRWKELISQFRQENFKLYHLSSSSVFAITLECGLSALKTPQCYRKDNQKNPDCPVCSPHLNELAQSLPCSHCSQSKLICFVTGEPLNENNHPMMLPNGNVYGEVALKQMVATHGYIICPRTKEVYEYKDAVKVYVM